MQKGGGAAGEGQRGGPSLCIGLAGVLQTVTALIRLLLEEQSDVGPHCLQK